MKAKLTDFLVSHDSNGFTQLDVQWIGKNRKFSWKDLEDFLNYEGGSMAAFNYASEEGAVIPTVRVADLWAVFPELEGDESPAEFAGKVRLAADLARKEDAHDDLRGRLDGVFDHGYAHGVTDTKGEEEDVND